MMHEVVVKRFRCDFCPKGLAAKSRMKTHEAICWKNPAAQSCGTCANYSPWDGFYNEPEGCSAVADDILEWATGKPKPRDCPSWSADVDVDAATGCADDQTFANVSAESIRAALSAGRDK